MGGLTHSLWVICRDVTSTLSQQERILDAAVSSRTRAALIDVDTHYRGDTDTALLCLRVDASRLSDGGLAAALDQAAAAGVVMLDPSVVSKTAASADSVGEYLRQFDRRALGFPTIAAALHGLAFVLHGDRRPPVTTSGAMPIAVRFQRGDTWSEGRACTLSAHSVEVATNGSARVGERIQIELVAIGNPRARPIRGERSEGAERPQSIVVPAVVERPPSGAAGITFSARFVVDDGDRDLLGRLVDLASAGATAVAPPPPRRDPRYLLRWPAELTRSGRAFSAKVLDISARGLFVAVDLGKQPALRYGDEVEARLPPDDRDAILARARVVRRSERRRDRPPGFGLELDLDRLTSTEKMILDRFVHRVARRSELLVAVAAASATASPIADELQSVGYAARRHDLGVPSPVAEPGADLVLVDETGRPHAVGSGRIVRIEHEQPALVRRLVDELLLTDSESGP